MKVNTDLMNLKNNSLKVSENNKFIDIPIKFSEISEKISIIFLRKDVNFSSLKINFFSDVITSIHPILIIPEVLNSNEIVFSLDYSNIDFKLNIGRIDILEEDKLIQSILIQIVKDKNIFYKNLLY